LPESFFQFYSESVCDSIDIIEVGDHLAEVVDRTVIESFVPQRGYIRLGDGGGIPSELNGKIQ